MAVIRKTTRVSNPRRKYRRAKNVKRNAKGHFVKRTRNTRRHSRKRTTKAKTKSPVIRRYAVKALKKELKRRGVKVNPTARRRRHSRKRSTRKRNPVLIELGSMVNPRRRKNVAKRTRKRRTRKTRNPRRHAVAKVTRRRRRITRRRRTANPVARTHRRRRTVRVGTRRRRRVMNRRRHHSRRRNPAIFGMSGGKDLLMMVGGGLVGVAATKYLPTLLPGSITSGLGGGAMVSVLMSGAGAFAAGWLAKRFVGQKFGDAVLFGGLMQAGSQLLTMIAPSALSSRLALSGLGEIVPGSFTVPQNPITSYRAPVVQGSGMGNLRRFGTFR